MSKKTALLCIIMVCFLCTVVTAQATTPTAYNYDISTYTSDVATTPTAANAAAYQAYAGYSAYSQTDATSSVVASNIPTSSICFINAHGITNNNDNGGGVILGKNLGKYTFIVAKNTMHGIDYQEILKDYAQKTNLLMVFVSCYSADTAPIGNLLDAAQEKGVDCAIGFSGTIDNTKSNHWANKFWEHVSYDGQKISDASTNAVSDATWIFPWGLSLGVNNVEIRGSGQGNIYITPARFGNW